MHVDNVNIGHWARLTVIVATVCAIAAVLTVGGYIGPVDGERQSVGTIETEHFEIHYHEGYEDEAESIASYADSYFELPYQKFSVEPPTERTSVVVGSLDDLRCDGTGVEGCYVSGVSPAIEVTSDDPHLFYHEAIHRFQADAIGSGNFINPPGAVPKPEVIVEGTTRYLERPAESISAQAQFSQNQIDLTTTDASLAEYDELALFTEYVLDEYGREGIDSLYTGVYPDDLETVAGKNVDEIHDDFFSQLQSQQQRMNDGGAVFPAFTYEPFVITPSDEVTFDATTPDPLEALDRSWYPDEPTAYEWDLTGDGEIDKTGAIVTATEPAEEVTLFVTVDGETHEVTQELLRFESDLTVIESTLEDDSIQEGESTELTTTLTNDGDIEGEKELKLKRDGNTIETKRVSVQPDSERSVTMDVTGEEVGTYEITLNNDQVSELAVVEPAEVSVVDIVPVDTQVEQGNSAEVQITLENTGPTVGEKSFTLEFDGVSISYGPFTVAPNETYTDILPLSSPDVGTYDLTRDGKQLAEITIYDQSAISVVDTELSTTEIPPGEPLLIEATVENSGEVTVEQDITIELSETVLENRSVTLPPGEQKILEFEHEFDHDADHVTEKQLTVGDGTPKQVIVENASAEDDSSGAVATDEQTDSLIDDDGVGFGIVTATVATLLLSVLATRRNRR